MGGRKSLEIVMVSGACCSPSLAAVEKDLEKLLRNTVAQVGLAAEVKVVSLSHILARKSSLDREQEQLIQAMFQKFGARFAPAGLVGQRVLFAGSAPSPDRLKEPLGTL